MADNAVFQATTPATPPAGTVVKADDVGGGQLVQYVKLDIGGDGASSPVVAANPLPISAATLPIPTGAATAALQTAGNASLTSLVADAGVTVAWDNVLCTYDGSNNLTVAQYRVGVVVVATRTMTYDGSNNLLTVTKT